MSATDHPFEHVDPFDVLVPDRAGAGHEPPVVGDEIELALDQDGVIHRVMTSQYGRLACAEAHWPDGVWTFTGSPQAVTCGDCEAAALQELPL